MPARNSPRFTYRLLTAEMVGELDERGGGGKERVETEGVTPSSASLAHPPRSPVLIGWTLSSCPPHPFDQTPSSQIHHPPPAPASQWPPSRLSRRCCASWPPGKVQHMASEARVDRAASQPLNWVRVRQSIFAEDPDHRERSERRNGGASAVKRGLFLTGLTSREFAQRSNHFHHARVAISR